MKVIEKMNQLVNSNVDEEKIKKWAYNNRILVSSVFLESEFECLEKTVNQFYENPENEAELDEYKSWDKFLAYDYVE